VPGAKPVRYYLYIPTPDGNFKARVEADSKRKFARAEGVDKGVKWSEEAAHEALKRLLKATPQSFPPGTKMISRYTRFGGPPTIYLNRAFLNATWWENSARGRAAIYALTNTATHTKERVWSSSDEESLRFFVEGKPIEKLGAMDLSEAIESDYLTMKGDDVVFKYMQNP